MKCQRKWWKYQADEDIENEAYQWKWRERNSEEKMAESNVWKLSKKAKKEMTENAISGRHRRQASAKTAGGGGAEDGHRASKAAVALEERIATSAAKKK